jgi:hypothetical protein
MANKTYRIRIARDGEEFEAEGDKNFVLQMLKRYETSRTGRTELPKGKHETLTSQYLTAKSPASKTKSAGEFIRQFSFKKHTDMVLAFGYYLEKMAGLPDFTAADINKCYYEAKLENSNTSQIIIQNIKRTFLMEAKGQAKTTKDGRKRFTLTQSGQAYIEKILEKAKEQ